MKTFSLAAYTRTLADLVVCPGAFFTERFNTVSVWHASGVLFLSALFSAMCLAMLSSQSAPLLTGMIGFVNGIFMTAVGCAIGYLVCLLIVGNRPSLSRLWALYSLSSGAVLLIAWVPSAFFLTEPWRWVLIGMGMVRGLKINRSRAVFIVLFTFGTTVLTVYAILAILNGKIGGN